MKISKAALHSNYIRENYPANKRSISYRKRVHGVGINDADYVTKPLADGKREFCIAYRTWSNMMERAYGHNFHARRPTYAGVIVCDEWHSFMSFRAWFIRHHSDECELDKDLLVPGGKIYSPTTCAFIPVWLNNFCNDCSSSRGSYMRGVSFSKARLKFVAFCSDGSGRPVNLGRFKLESDAHEAWKSYKMQLAVKRKDEMDAIDERLFAGVVHLIKDAA
ncbi:hypothetical protein OB953_00260 [Aeromonas salmonicida]|uniref:hypothetical protein n=1 Tax=Aeromonas salmonicida TaxID=645 RepID=UPI00259EF1C6|nr:hypothetical protein [Aeromonas salmonicida]MDM5134044.1 hypothetical protein [Aeromonas salmonicida]